MNPTNARANTSTRVKVPQMKCDSDIIRSALIGWCCSDTSRSLAETSAAREQQQFRLLHPPIPTFHLHSHISTPSEQSDSVSFCCKYSITDRKTHLCLMFSQVNGAVCRCQSCPYGNESARPDRNKPVQLPADPLCTHWQYGTLNTRSYGGQKDLDQQHQAD